MDSLIETLYFNHRFAFFQHCLFYTLAHILAICEFPMVRCERYTSCGNAIKQVYFPCLSNNVYEKHQILPLLLFHLRLIFGFRIAQKCRKFQVLINICIHLHPFGTTIHMFKIYVDRNQNNFAFICLYPSTSFLGACQSHEMYVCSTKLIYT